MESVMKKIVVVLLIMVFACAAFAQEGNELLTQFNSSMDMWQVSDILTANKINNQKLQIRMQRGMTHEYWLVATKDLSFFFNKETGKLDFVLYFDEVSKQPKHYYYK